MFQIFNYLPLTFNDSPEPWGLFFQDNETPQMEGLEELHNIIMFYLVIILFAVSWIMLSIKLNYNKAKISNKHTNHGTLVELIWTITPTLIVVLIAFSSFKLLYLMDEIIDPSLIIYGKDHQWYWYYQYPDFTNKDEEFIEFDTYIVYENNFELRKLRILKIDSGAIIPELTHTRFVEGYFLYVDLYSYILKSLENYLFLNLAPDASPEFGGLLFQDDSSSVSSSSSISQLSPLEGARLNSINSNEIIREAKFNLHLNQANTFDLLERVANRELSDTARSTFSQINNYRQDITNEINRIARGGTINARTESGRAMIEADAGFSHLVIQQRYLDQGYSLVQSCGANFTMNEHNQCAGNLNQNTRLWEEYRQVYLQHINNLQVQRPLDYVNNQSNGYVRRTSLVREYAHSSSSSSDSDS